MPAGRAACAGVSSHCPQAKVRQASVVLLTRRSDLMCFGGVAARGSILAGEQPAPARPRARPRAPRAPMGTTLARGNRPRRRLDGSDGLLRVRQSLALLSGAPDPWSRVADGGSVSLDRLQAVGRSLGVARLLVSTEDGDAPLDVWCGPVSSRAMRPLPADARPVAGSRRIYCRSGILALPLRGPHVVFGVLTLIARSERQGWSEEQIQGGLELAQLAGRRARPVRGPPAGARELRFQPRRARPRFRATWRSSMRRAGWSRRTTRGRPPRPPSTPSSRAVRHLHPRCDDARRRTPRAPRGRDRRRAARSAATADARVLRGTTRPAAAGARCACSRSAGRRAARC